MSMFAKIKSAAKRALPSSLVARYASIILYLRKKNALARCQGLTLQTQAPSPQIIVNLTSYGRRVSTTAPYAIATLLDQTILPDRIILWLAYGTQLPTVYKTLVGCGLEIKYCDDLKSYKKLVPALKAFPEDVLITADDDVFYPRDWFEKFKMAYHSDPEKIYAVRAHQIGIDSQGEIQPYEDWDWNVTTGIDTKRLFPTGVCGILYPPHSLDSRCTDEQTFLALAPYGDDIWFWAMAKLRGTEYGLIENGYLWYDSIDPSDKGLYGDTNGNVGNDRQIKRVIEVFPEIMDKVI